MINAARMSWADYDQLADPDDVVVAIDPAGSTGEKSDYTGIVVVARIRRNGYVLHSERRKWTSPEWAQRAVELLYEYKASRVVIEVSGAGSDALVRAVEQRDGGVRVVGMSASGRGGKMDRAAPVAGLYIDQQDGGYGRQ